MRTVQATQRHRPALTRGALWSSWGRLVGFVTSDVASTHAVKHHEKGYEAQYCGGAAHLNSTSSYCAGSRLRMPLDIDYTTANW
jgi:hypothetical protein